MDGAEDVTVLRASGVAVARALSNAARPPHRSRRLIWVSARLPVPLLLGLRLAARRPRRTLLNVASIAVTASGIVTVLCVYAGYGQSRYASAGLADPQTGKLSRVLLVFTVALVTLAVVNAILIAWAMVLDNRYASALIRALGATPEQASTGLAAAQALPGLAGALLGIPGGIELFGAVSKDGTVIVPSAWWLAAMVTGAVGAIAAITVFTSRLGARRTTAGVLQAEAAP